MITVSNIFGGAEPRFGVVELIFGGARLRNVQTVFQKPLMNAALTSDRKRHACRAAGPACAKFASPFPIVARDSGRPLHRPGPNSSARLGAPIICKGSTRRGFQGSLAGCSGATRLSSPKSSPHQSCDHGAALMTITKTFVTYFKHPIVSL
jgi:hypothetical protein